MPTKPPSDRTCAAFRRPAGPELCRGELAEGPSPEFCPGAPGLTSGFSPIMQNEPKYRSANSQKPTANSQEMRNEPNFTHSGPVEDTKKTKRTQFHKANSQSPKAKSQKPRNAKRTQFPTTNIHSTIYNIQSLAPIPQGQQPIAKSQKLLFTKRTQFTSRSPSATPKNAKRTQSLPGNYAKRTQSKQINPKPLQHKHLGQSGHKSLQHKHLGQDD